MFLKSEFENTSTKTSIIIFDNTKEKTTVVKFSTITVERYTEDKFEEIYGNIQIIENKDAFARINETFISQATREEILGHTLCSLSGTEYENKEIIVGKGYKLVRFGSICDYLSKSKRKASFGKKTGKYNFYTSSETIKKCDIADYNKEVFNYW